MADGRIKNQKMMKQITETEESGKLALKEAEEREKINLSRK